MERVDDWLTALDDKPNVPGAPRPPPKPSTKSANIDLTGSSTASSPSAASSSSSIRVIEKPRPRPIAPIFAPRPQIAVPLRAAERVANAPPPFVSNAASFGMTAKQRAMLSMKAEHQRMGVPIGVPVNPAYKRPVPPPAFADEEEAVRKAMANVRVGDDLGADGQEAALKELLGSTVDMSNVDTTGDLPEGLRVKQLFPHQIEGLHWLKSREEGKKRGGILADEMGLGKTVQMLSLMLAKRAVSKPKTTLVVCPVGLMKQWEKEIETKSDGSLRVLVHHGSSRTKSGSKLERYDVVITSYETTASEWVDPKPKAKKGKGKAVAGDEEEGSDDDSSLAKIKSSGALFDAEFYRIILDEAHEIRSRATRKHKACCALESKYKWALTGTPLQNSVVDIYSLFAFLGKKIVNPLHEYPEFKAKIEQPLKNKRAKIAMARLTVVLKAIMLRRKMTSDLLPPMEINDVTGGFIYPDEQKFYESVEDLMKQKLSDMQEAGNVRSNYTNVLGLILRMRQACSHPSLTNMKVTSALEAAALDEAEPDETPSGAATPEGKNIDDELDDLVGTLDKLRVAPAAQRFSKSGKLEYSTKIYRALEILKKIREEGRKTIVFSQFTSMFDVLEPFLVEEGFNFVRFDGKMNPKQKAAVLDQLREDPKVTVILVSIKCGSVGLNLTVCSRCILLDLSWNPAIESQAFGRVHRMGQLKDVKIYKITVDNTIEDRILKLQATKADLAKAALDGGALIKSGKLTDADIMYLFRGDRRE